MNELQIRRTFELLKKEDELFEVRVIANPREIYSGYFKSVDKLIEALSRYDKGNIYLVLNSINDACYNRDQQDRFLSHVKNSTSDNDIANRDWILIDIDPTRSSGVSSTNDEKSNSKAVINQIFSYLRDVGFAEPIVCDSGNGFHLLYKVDMPNIPENTEIIKKFLYVLGMYFTTKHSEVDTSVHNAARITKLYGTVARKGSSSDDRPHRYSTILKHPAQVKVTPIELLQKVADNYPQAEKGTYENKYNTEAFDIDKYISDNSIPVKSKSSFDGGTRYILDHCLFDHSHTGKDAAIFKTKEGVYGYKCFHSSCSQFMWKDVRRLFDPTYTGDFNYQSNRTYKKKAAVHPQPTDSVKGDKFVKFSKIEMRDRSQIVTIKSGYNQLDMAILGFNKGEITVWSGKNGSAKSTIINQVAINAINEGFKGIIFSGELPDFKMKSWIHAQCAGRQFVSPSKFGKNLYYVKRSVSEKIDMWLDGKLYLYNNEYGNNFEQLVCDMEEFIDKEDIDFVILDNLMALDLLTLEGDKYQQQTRFINRLCTFVRKKNVHLHIVAHPRKNTGFLRKEDISGTADLTNAVDNVIICHRNNNDYKRAVVEYFGNEGAQGLTIHDNYIEVCKNRDMGIIDEMIGLYFEPESKRLLNDLYENKVYGWQDIDTQIVMQEAQQQIPISNQFPLNEPFKKAKEDAPF